MRRYLRAQTQFLIYPLGGRAGEVGVSGGKPKMLLLKGVLPKCCLKKHMKNYYIIDELAWWAWVCFLELDSGVMRAGVLLVGSRWEGGRAMTARMCALSWLVIWSLKLPLSLLLGEESLKWVIASCCAGWPLTFTHIYYLECSIVGYCIRFCHVTFDL
jgi:hypothetical protein